MNLYLNEIGGSGFNPSRLSVRILEGFRMDSGRIPGVVCKESGGWCGVGGREGGGDDGEMIYIY